jgi:rod shape-determining protein MreD
MSQTLAAVGAVLMAVLQSTIVPFLVVDGATPDLLLVYAIVLAVIIGLDHGVIAAFVGGTTLDALAVRPFGSTAFVLLVVVGIAALLGRLLARGRALSVVVAVVLLGSLAPLASLVVYGALRAPIPAADPMATAVPNMAYSAAIALVVAPIASRIHRRYFERERIDW